MGFLTLEKDNKMFYNMIKDSIRMVNMLDISVIPSNSVQSLHPMDLRVQFLLSKIDDVIKKLEDSIKTLIQKIETFLAAVKGFLTSHSSAALDQLEINHAELNGIQQQAIILGFELSEGCVA